MLIANRKVENQVKTYITYNKGRDWRLLQAPSTDLEGNEIYCVLVRERAGGTELRLRKPKSQGQSNKEITNEGPLINKQ